MTRVRLRRLVGVSVLVWIARGLTSVAQTPATIAELNERINKTVVPVTPESPTPLSGSLNVPLGTPVTWRALGAITYDVQWCAGAACTPVTVTTVVTPTYTPPPTITGLQRWRIVARNPKGTATGPIWQLTPVLVPPACVYSVTPVSSAIGAPGGSGTVTITTAAGCAWTTASDAVWLTVPAGSNGSGTAIYTVVANPTTMARIGTLTIAGQAITVTQDGAPPPCGFTVAPLSSSLAATGGSGSLTVTTAAGCAWTAMSSAPWLVLSAGGNGVGSGMATYTASTNPTATPRTGTILIAGQTVMITQAAAPPVMVPPRAVTTFAIPSASDTTFTVSWTEVDDGAGQPAKYDIRVWAPPPMQWPLASSVFTGTCVQPLVGTTIGAVRSCTITGLTANGSFDVQMAAFRGTSKTDPAIVWGPLSAVITGHTLPPAPPPTGRLNLQWDPGVAPPGMPVVTNFQARCGPSPGVYTTTVDTGLSLTAAVQNLPLSVPSYCAAFAYNGLWSAASNEVTALPTPSLAFSGSARPQANLIRRAFSRFGDFLRIPK